MSQDTNIAPKTELLHPTQDDFAEFDGETRRLLKATVDWFENRGKTRLLKDYVDKVFYQDFLDFAASEKLFATFLTPAADGAGNADKRWDTARVAKLSEILGFYGLNYWYPWQVTVLGLGPVWQSTNTDPRKRAADLLDDGAVAAFGLSEQAHGADIYSTDLVLTPVEGGGYKASGRKYYIGNGNCARIVSVFGRVEGRDGLDQYVFFLADSEHPNYTVIKNVVPSQMYVAEFELDEYPVSEDDILHVGADAFSAALNTVNIGKFNLCFGGIGLSTHALYESVTHAHNRILYGSPVTKFDHVRREFVDAYARLMGMKLFSERAVDYFRTASPEDRRYLLFNPVTKMKATTEAEKVLALLGDVMSAKAFEAETYTTAARIDVAGLPKLEGTVAVNLALILKFMPAYLHHSQDLAVPGVQLEARDDEFLFNQGPASGLGKVQFHDWRKPFAENAGIPNVAAFTERAEALATLVAAEKDAIKSAGLDLQLSIGELFTLVVYGGLILEQAKLRGADEQLIDQIFEILNRDFSQYAVDLIGKREATATQRQWAKDVISEPVFNSERFDAIWNRVEALSGVYEMRA
ncbi:acyl-CoA dehydrogenase, putative [Mycolicibacterium phlei]|uniref:acyl-CoA dehydrogenase n=1 Tax=Mycobacteroides chelonae TaxID=1774 RepID=UPI000618CC6D|nr:acyl-CoA dehydrogenase [Mycobacteroides chelonae]VEG18919.1 acyl-CoA dehydrogenase, putative [Mycolicibacterium phlei]AKC39889.1 acyl-CoA dehydrogenase [Mycobacteroides chelonae]ANA99458.1 acyl-CoA dehydrogenase [Mycobacteroides chelonae CCUG 47445]OLT82711.1 acyl-CoA dehydrogenase [Mycobacteroides chelonae]ORV16277.1 acyl-CoA dehydrogenase [Mycobacteroides chelonae]